MYNPDANSSLTFLRRRPDITEEEFYYRWGEVHARLVAPWAAKHGLEYTQIHTPQSVKEVSKAKARLQFREEIKYDGAAHMRFKNVDQFKAAFLDPYYINVINPDEKNFLDMDSTQPIGAAMLGASKPIVVNGKPAVDCEKQTEVWKQWEAKAGAS